ncbi:MAG: GNAT family N-acetyltransferase [Gemmatimonadaceae bacterium]
MARISSERLDLVAMTWEIVDALIGGDADRLATLTGARFRVPVQPPPLTRDALPFMRDRLNADPTEVGWSQWLIMLRESSAAAGSAGFVGKPDDAGVVTIGYSIYPEFEGRGIATEATRALMEWVFDQEEVMRVRATIPPWHASSLRVARKAGMKRVGTAHDDDVGEVFVFEKTKPTICGAVLSNTLRGNGATNGRSGDHDVDETVWVRESSDSRR